MARTYPVKKGIKLSSDYILETAKKITETAQIKNGHILASFPGMKVIDLYTDGKTLFAETESDTNHGNFAETVKLYNDLIEAITGFSSKERKKRFSKA